MDGDSRSVRICNAQHEFAIMMLKGEIPGKGKEQAIEWLKKASEGGNEKAGSILASMSRRTEVKTPNANASEPETTTKASNYRAGIETSPCVPDTINLGPADNPHTILISRKEFERSMSESQSSDNESEFPRNGICRVNREQIEIKISLSSSAR